MRYFNVFKKMYVMYLSVRKFYYRGCDGFSYVKDQRTHRVFIHTKNNTPFHPTGIL